MQVLEIDHSDTPIEIERMQRAAVPPSGYKRESQIEALATINDGNTIIGASTGLQLDVMWDIYATATYGFNYETDPAPGQLSKDPTLAFGLGAKF
jgi:hypothetical protein